MSSFSRTHLVEDEPGVMRQLDALGAKDLPLWAANLFLDRFRELLDLPIEPVSVSASAGTRHYRTLIHILYRVQPPGRRQPQDVLLRLRWSEGRVSGAAESSARTSIVQLAPAASIHAFVRRNASEICRQLLRP